MRQNVKRQVRNRARKSALKSQVRKLSETLAAKNLEAAEKEFRSAQKLLDRTAAYGTIHKKTAARRKSRLAKRLNAAKAGAAK